MTRHRLALVVAAALAAAAVVGCGVPDDAEPRPMAADNVPFQLLSPATTTSTVPVADDGRQTTVSVFFVTREGGLQERDRVVPGVPDVSEVIEALLAGPTPEERAANLTTAITEGTQLLGIEQAEGLVTVDLSSDLLSVTGVSQVQAIAQVVFTVTDLYVGDVLFRFDGERAEVPDGRGELTAEPLNRFDFRDYR